MDQVSAFAPGNISGVFKIIYHEDATQMHSLGTGFTVKEGVVAKVYRDGRTTVLFNEERIRFPTVVAVVQELTSQPMRIEIASPLPLGCGFGLSGASALAAAYAVNALCRLGKSELELAMIAHVAEVENRTGLGDVCAQYHGGCLVKLREGHPLDAQQLPVREQAIFYKYFSTIQTRDVLENVEQRARINSAADEALRCLERFTKSNTVDFSAYVRVSKTFAINSGLLTDANVQRAIEEIEADTGVASMIMLGNAVFGTHSFEGAEETTLAKHRVRIL
jgi:pantoate kinase